MPWRTGVSSPTGRPTCCMMRASLPPTTSSEWPVLSPMNWFTRYHYLATYYLLCLFYVYNGGQNFELACKTILHMQDTFISSLCCIYLENNSSLLKYYIFWNYLCISISILLYFIHLLYYVWVPSIASSRVASRGCPSSETPSPTKNASASSHFQAISKGK